MPERDAKYSTTAGSSCPTPSLKISAVIIEDGKIAAIAAMDEAGSDGEWIDVGGSPDHARADRYPHPRRARPHLQRTDCRRLRDITRENARRGVTALLADHGHRAHRRSGDCLAFGREWMAGAATRRAGAGHARRRPLLQSGAGRCAGSSQHPQSRRRHASSSLLAHHDIIRIFTFAPELPGARGAYRRGWSTWASSRRPATARPRKRKSRR